MEKTTNHITNSFKGLESGPLRSRLAYAYYLVMGLFFLAAAIFTLYNVLTVWLKYYGLDEARQFRSGLFLAYVLLNLMTSWGFLLCRKWLVPVLGSSMLVLAAPYIYRGMADGFGMDKSLSALLVSVALFASVLLTRRLLAGELWKKPAVISFALILLLTIFITKTNLIY